MNRSAAFACAAVLALGACTSRDAAPQDSVAARAVAAVVVAVPNSSAAPVPGAKLVPGDCVSEGDWHLCSVEKRLTDAGFVPIKKGDSPAGIFDVAGKTIGLGPAELHVYLFKSAQERTTAIAAIDTVAVSRRGSTVPWPTPPTLITSNNLVAILLSDNGRLIERVQNAITAGLPSAAH